MSDDEPITDITDDDVAVGLANLENVDPVDVIVEDVDPAANYTGPPGECAAEVQPGDNDEAVE